MSSILSRLGRGPTPDATHSVSQAKVCGVIGGLAFAATLGGFLSGARLPRLEHRAIGSAASVDAPQVPRWNKLEFETATLATGAWLDPVASRVRPDERRVASVGVPLAGRVTEVYAELGQRVAKGTPLLAVAGLGFAQLSGEQARAKLDVSASQVTLARVEAIVESGALPARDAVTAAAELRSAKLELTAAEQEIASLAVTRQTDNEFVVKAPRAGYLFQKNVLPGQVLSGGAGALMSIADLSSLWVVGDLFGSAEGIVPGSPARVTLRALPDAVIEGTVEAISATVDAERRASQVRVRIDNPAGRIKVNMFATMQLYASASPGAVEIPASAVGMDGASQRVYVQEPDGHFTRRTVLVGAPHDGRVFVSSGIAAGETVVSNGCELLDNWVGLVR